MELQRQFVEDEIGRNDFLNHVGRQQTEAFDVSCITVVLKGNVHAQIFLARRFERHTEEKLGVAAELHRVIAQIKAEKRAPTDYELTLIEAAQAHLDPYKRLGMEPPEPGSIPKSRRRARGRRKRTEPGSDP